MKPLLIESSKNPRFQSWQELLESSGIRKQGLALVSGRKIIDELIRQKNKRIKSLLLPSLEPAPEFEKSSKELKQFISNCDASLEKPSNLSNVSKPQVYVLSKSLFQKLDVLGTHAPLAVVEVPTPGTLNNFLDLLQVKPPLSASETQAASLAGSKSATLMLPLGNPLNLGACIRSARAFGLSHVLLSRESANPYLPQAIRSSAGHSLYQSIFQSEFDLPSTLEKLADFKSGIGANSIQLFGLDQVGIRLGSEEFHRLMQSQNLDPRLSTKENQTSKPLSKQNPKQLRQNHQIFVAGEEGLGLPSSFPGTRLSIPMNSQVESLNVSVAVSILLFCITSTNHPNF